MKVGIFVYSRTGNTLEVAKRLQEALLDNEVLAEVFEIKADDEPNTGKPPVMLEAPEITGYDTLVFASYVHAFSINPIMKQYLQNIEELTNQYVYTFLTQHFRYSWLGGNRTLRQMSRLITHKNGRVITSGIVHQTSRDKELEIIELVNHLTNNIINQ